MKAIERYCEFLNDVIDWSLDHHCPAIEKLAEVQLSIIRLVISLRRA